MALVLDLISPKNICFVKEMRERNKPAKSKLEYEISLEKYHVLRESGAYDKPEDVKNRRPFRAEGIPEQKALISYDLPHWEVFENSVWKLFVQMNFNYVNKGKVGMRLDEDTYFGVNGVFINDQFVFLCKTFYAEKNKGQDIHSDFLAERVMHWMLKFEQSCDYLRSEILEFQNKRIIPLIVTRGYVLSQKTKNEIQDVHNAYVINNRFVNELDRIMEKTEILLGQFSAKSSSKENHCLM